MVQPQADAERRRRGAFRLYLTFLVGWALASILIVQTVVSNGDAGPAAPAWFFVLGTGVLVAALIQRDASARQATDALLARQQELIDAMGVVTDPRLAQLPVYQVLHELLTRARAALGADMAAVFLLDRPSGVLELSASQGLGEALTMDGRVTTTSVSLGEGLIGGVAQTRQAQVVHEANDVEGLVPELTHGMSTLVASALVAENNVVGVLVIGTAARRDMGEGDLRLLQLIADRVAAAIEASRLEEEAQRATLAADAARRHLALLADAGAVLARPFERIEELAEALGSTLVPEFADWFAFHAVDDEGDVGLVRSTPAIERDRALADDPDWAELVLGVLHGLHPKLLWGADLDQGAARLGLTSVAIVPLVVRGAAVGTLAMGTAGRRRGYRAADLRALGDLATRVAVTFERVLLFADIQARDARLRALYDASPVGIVELDADGAAVRWNRAAAGLFDWPAFEESRVKRQTVPLVAAAVALQSLADEQGTSAEVTLEDGDRRLELELASVPLREPDGAVRGVVLAAVDVTERKQVADQLQQAQRMEAMARLSGGIAHDFNNVLMVITGYTDLLLRRTDVDEETRHDVESIRAAATRAADLTRKLLAVSRHQPVAPAVVRIEDLLGGMRDVLSFMLGEEVELRVVIDEPAPVLADPAQLEQVVLNLAMNAKDAMPGGGTLTIEATATGCETVLRVADNGDGMDPATLEHCFEPFFTTKDRTKGSGLGLATVYGVVRQSGGEIAVTSAKGEGTTFTLRFPSAEAASAAPRPPRAKGRVKRTLRVLVVDDEPDLRAIVADMLELEGHEVTVAADAESALIAANADEPDLLLTDVVMPGADGIELARRFTAAHPGVPVLFMSAHVDEQRGVPLAGAELLAKPFSAEELVAKLRGVRVRSGSRRRAPS